jgi:hypothetical protein
MLALLPWILTHTWISKMAANGQNLPVVVSIEIALKRTLN